MKRAERFLTGLTGLHEAVSIAAALVCCPRPSCAFTGATLPRTESQARPCCRLCLFCMCGLSRLVGARTRVLYTLNYMKSASNAYQLLSTSSNAYHLRNHVNMYNNNQRPCTSHHTQQ